MTDVIVYFDVAIFRDYTCTPLSPDAEWPQRFLKFINEGMIQTGELLIPRLFRSKYDHDFVRDVKIVMPSGLSYPVKYSKNPNRLSGLGPLLAASQLAFGYCLIFLKASDSRLCVEVYVHDLVHVRM